MVAQSQPLYDTDSMGINPSDEGCITRCADMPGLQVQARCWSHACHADAVTHCCCCCCCCDKLLLLRQAAAATAATTAAVSSSCCMQMHVHLAPIQDTLLNAIIAVYKSPNTTWHVDCGGYSTLNNCKPLATGVKPDPSKHLKVSGCLLTSVIYTTIQVQYQCHNPGGGGRGTSSHPQHQPMRQGSAWHAAPSLSL